MSPAQAPRAFGNDGADATDRRLGEGRRGRISQRLLIMHRWIAIIGQTIAVIVVHYGLGFDMPLVSTGLLISASVMLNVVVMAQRSRAARLDDRAAALYLAFDILQLSALLYLTGGLQNPFAVLMLAPVTVAATMLARQAVFAVVGLAIACLSVLAVFYQPLPGPGGLSWVIPPTYLAGFWTALALSCFFISAYVYLIEREARRMSDALTATQMALIREQKVSALGALAAAAAHELGSPLSTIRLVAKELVRDLPPDSALKEDVELLVSESDRCRTILTELSRKPEPATANPFDRLALPTLVEEVARPRLPPTVKFALEIDADPAIEPPAAYFGPELQHGLGNIIQNASQFAGRKVTARLYWTDQVVMITIEDDGPGYPAHILDRLGEPYVSGRATKGENLGLGIFIAQTLLESLGADLSFSNPPAGGARVTIHWPRKLFEQGPTT
ncbi:MAG: ActS/PrrB/RegB family redox-sensitive histidine kinase [Alphaproteobacteria bacterium]|nr:ActS/PrrB/RegB family redox-sensitive histidine kinase [Alphaproteobacteria bacterium SS10]